MPITPASTGPGGAVQTYHELLDGAGGLLERTRDQLTEELSRIRFVFGGRLLSPYLRPHFVTRRDFNHIRVVCERVWQSISVVAEHALSDDLMVKYLGLTEDELKLVEIDPGFQGVSRTSRLDSFLTGERYHFVELNAESPAGIAYADVASDVFGRLDVMREFGRTHRWSPLSGRQRLLDVLLAAYAEFAPGAPRPRIGIVDFRGLPTEREFELFKEFFESRGYEAVIADPRELEYSDGKLRSGEFEIELVYKRVLVNEYLEKLPEAPALLQAYRDGAICMVNSFRGKIIHKKALFGVLTDELFERYFTPTEQDFLRRHIPWSRRIEDRRTTYQGQEMELLDWARAHRDRLVLKPNDEYGGKGIFLGWECGQAEWERAIEAGLTAAYVLQERVPTAREPFPCVHDNGQVEFADQLVDLDPLLFDGQVGSAFTRLSDTGLCNVTAGGGMVPTFILEESAT
ncbi:MAG: hypothetical protein HY650_05805 [Acidobacteria bacterium]|nr:hypothetical protein [Acidobacteriota bacterium]